MIWRSSLQSGSIRSGALLSMAVRGVGLVLGFALHILLSRTLGPDSYGRYAIVLGWALIFVIPSRLGLDTAALKYAALYHQVGDHHRLATFQRFSVRVMVTGASLWVSIGIGAAALAAWQSGSDLNWPELLAFAAMVFPLAAIGYYSALLRAAGKIVASQVYEQVVRPLVLVAGLAGLAIFGSVTLNSSLLLTAVGLWVVLAWIVSDAIRIHPVPGGQIDPVDRKIWLKTGGTLLAISAIQELMNQVDIILLGWAGQPGSAGLFSAASRLSSLVTFGLVAVAMVAASPIAVSHKNGDLEGMARIAVEAARLSTLVAIVIAVLLNLLAAPLLALFGASFVAAMPALAVLCVGGVINAMTGVVAYLLSMTGHERQLLWVVAAALVCNVVLNLALVPKWGATGAAVAAAGGISFLNIVAAILVRSRLGIDGTILARRPR